MGDKAGYTRVDILQYFQSETAFSANGNSNRNIFSDEELLKEVMCRTLQEKRMPTLLERAVYMTWQLWHSPPKSAFAVLLDTQYRHKETFCLREGGMWIEDLTSLLGKEMVHTAAYLFIGHNHVNGILVPSLEDIRTEEILRRRLNTIGKPRFLESYITDSGFNWIQVQNK